MGVFNPEKVNRLLTDASLSMKLILIRKLLRKEFKKNLRMGGY